MSHATWHFKLGHFKNCLGQTMILKLWTTDIFMLFRFNCHSLLCKKWTKLLLPFHNETAKEQMQHESINWWRNDKSRNVTMQRFQLCSIAWGYWILLLSWWFLLLTCPKGKCCYLGKFKLQKDCDQSYLSKRVLGLVEMTCRLVHASYSLPKWQAVKLILFAPWVFHNDVECLTQKLIVST